MYRTHGIAWYPLFSTTFKYLTCIPDTVKYGISNLTVIGVRLCGAFAGSASASPRTLGSPKCARRRYSLPPARPLSFHTNAARAGTYVAKALSRRRVGHRVRVVLSVRVLGPAQTLREGEESGGIYTLGPRTYCSSPPLS